MIIFYLSGKKLFIMDKLDIVVYYENGKEVFFNLDDGIKINGEVVEKFILDMFLKNNLLKIVFYLLIFSIV